MSFLALRTAWETPCPSPSAKLVLLAIADCISKAGVAWPSVGEIARKTELASRTVLRQIIVLEESGLIECKKTQGRSNRYSLTTPDTASPPPMTDCHPCHSVTPDTVSETYDIVSKTPDTV